MYFSIHSRFIAVQDNGVAAQLSALWLSLPQLLNTQFFHVVLFDNRCLFVPDYSCLNIFVFSYQFLEDAYRNHRQCLETMTQQLQEKRKAIEEVSSCINGG